MLLGCNVPKLLAITIQELKLEEQYKAGEYERVFYEFDQLLPDEQEREVIKMQIEEEISRIEMEQAIQQRKEYIRFVTDEIMLHIIDCGISLFFPHAMKEAYRKTADIADKMELACKDRKIIKIKPEMMEVLYYEIDNPLEPDVIEYLFTKEILIFLWKIGETDTRMPEEVLKIFHKTVAEPSLTPQVKILIELYLKKIIYRYCLWRIRREDHSVNSGNFGADWILSRPRACNSR